jgi:hypothetical protein
MKMSPRTVDAAFFTGGLLLLYFLLLYALPDWLTKTLLHIAGAWGIGIGIGNLFSRLSGMTALHAQRDMTNYALGALDDMHRYASELATMSREGWRYAEELEQERRRLMAERGLAADPLHDREIYELVNRLSSVAMQYGPTPQLRDRVSQEVVPVIRRLQGSARDVGAARQEGTQ